MRLTLAPGDSDQILLAEPRRMGQHRLGYLDLVVMGEPPDQAHRRILQTREPLAQFTHRLALDPVDQALEDVIEQRRFGLRGVRSGVEKQIRDAAEHCAALLARAVADGVFDFGERRGGHGHVDAWRRTRPGNARAATMACGSRPIR